MKSLRIVFSLFVSSLLALGILFMCAGSSDAAISDGLVGYWSFNDGTAKDGSGLGNHGVIKGAPKSVNGKMGKCLDFNGKTDYVEVPDSTSLQLADALTVAAWVNIRTLVNHGGICWKGEKVGWGANFNFRIATTTDGLTWGTTTAANENYFATAGAADKNKWNFVCMTADGKQAIAYVSKDGAKLEKPTSGEGNPKASPTPYNVWKGQPVRIGMALGIDGNLDSFGYFDGMIDEVSIYKRALSEAEIKDLMTLGLATTAVSANGKIAATWASIKAE